MSLRGHCHPHQSFLFKKKFFSVFREPLSQPEDAQDLGFRNSSLQNFPWATFMATVVIKDIAP